MQSSILAEQLVEDHATSRRDIQRVLDATHGQPYLRIATPDERGRQPLDLVSKKQRDGKARSPVKEIDRPGAGFDRGDLVSLVAKDLDLRRQLSARFPGNMLLSAQCRLRNLSAWGATRDPRQADPVETNGVSGPKERTNVIQATHIVEHDADRKRTHSVIRGRVVGRRERGSVSSCRLCHETPQYSETMNGYAIVVMIALFGEYVLSVLSGVLTLRTVSPTIPPEFRGVFDAARYAKSQAYTRATTRFGLLHQTFRLGLVLAVWHLGGFAWLDGVVRTLPPTGQGPIVSGLLFIGVLGFGSVVAGLPFRLYRTFVIEAKFGFNRTTPRTFALDLLKGAILTVVLGGGILAGVLAFFEWAGPLAWLWCWTGTAATILLVQFVAPTVIMPWFNTFTPLAHGDLRDALVTYAKSVKFPLQGIFVVDGSKRSSKANAFFTGFGRQKRIGLFDTLVDAHTVDELVAIVAHEVGHYRKGHLLKGLVLQLVYLGALFFLMSLVLQRQGLFDAFYVTNVSVYAGLVFFGLVFTPIELVLSLVVQAMSRRNEFEADAYAARTAGGEPLIAALKKLSADTLTNLTPHPLDVLLHDSHPPVLKRVTALRGLVQTRVPS